MDKKLVSEFIGTFILVFAGCGAIVVETLTGALGHVCIAPLYKLNLLTKIKGERLYNNDNLLL